MLMRRKRIDFRKKRRPCANPAGTVSATHISEPAAAWKDPTEEETVAMEEETVATEEGMVATEEEMGVMEEGMGDVTGGTEEVTLETDEETEEMDEGMVEGMVGETDAEICEEAVTTWRKEMADGKLWEKEAKEAMLTSGRWPEEQGINVEVPPTTKVSNVAILSNPRPAPSAVKTTETPAAATLTNHEITMLRSKEVKTNRLPHQRPTRSICSTKRRKVATRAAAPRPT